jgi:hypothetical protein
MTLDEYLPSIEPQKGDRKFRIWSGGLSPTVWAGIMRYDGQRWVSTGTRHDVTEDFTLLAPICPKCAEATGLAAKLTR